MRSGDRQADAVHRGAMHFEDRAGYEPRPTETFREGGEREEPFGSGTKCVPNAAEASLCVSQLNFPLCPALRQCALSNRSAGSGCWANRSSEFSSIGTRVLSGLRTGRRKNLTATVAAAVDKARLAVVTVYRTRKIAEYWRAE